VSAEPQPPDPAAKSVFSKLPDSRPGVRSPRRRSSAGAETGTPRPRQPRQPPTPRHKPDAAAPPPQERRREPPAAAEQRTPRGLEDAAWAGIAVAAEAATIGVRLANRALEALRDAGERR
jgi:hypothetical protein